MTDQSDEHSGSSARGEAAWKQAMEAVAGRNQRARKRDERSARPTSASATMHVAPPKPEHMHGCSTAGKTLRPSRRRSEHPRGAGRAEASREVELIREQIESGQLVRQMTPAERAKYPPRPAVPKRRRW